MPKRKSHGRSKGDKGSTGMIQCDQCGKSVPRDKAKKIYKKGASWIDPRLAYELRKKGAYIDGAQTVRYLCISCSIHRGYYSPRAHDDRRKPFKKPRRD